MENEEALAGGLQLVKVGAVGKSMTVHSGLEKAAVTVEAGLMRIWGERLWEDKRVKVSWVCKARMVDGSKFGRTRWIEGFVSGLSGIMI